MAWLIRNEEMKDVPAISDVIQAAFEREVMSDHQEHHLVERLRQTTDYIPELAYVATMEDGTIVGHVMFSRAHVVHANGTRTRVLALAPVSVLPHYQRQGIGRALIEQGLADAVQLGFTSVIVLGHPSYYTTFGFKPAHHFGITPPFDVPEDAFMALPLKNDALKNIKGMVQYSDAFV